MTDFNLADLRVWRKKHKISQEKFAVLADLGINTILKIEAGKHKVQAQTFDKIRAAIREVEAKSAGVTATPTVVAPTPKPAPVVEPTIPFVKSGAHYNPIQLTNIDIELIHRILMMDGREKLKVLESLMG